MPSYALFSVNDTRHIGDFANSLSALGWGIICTSKPYEELKKLGAQLKKQESIDRFFSRCLAKKLKIDSISTD